MYKDRTQFAGQHVRVPEAVAKVDRDPAPEVHQEEGAAVGEQERRYSIVSCPTKTLSYRKLFFTRLSFVIKGVSRVNQFRPPSSHHDISRVYRR